MPERLLTAISLKERQNEATVAALADLKTGAVRTQFWPAKLRLLGLSPDGTKAMLIQMEKGENFGKGAYLTIADLTKPKFPCIAAFEPFAEGTTRMGRSGSEKIASGAWIDDDLVLLSSENDHLMLLSLRTAQPVWVLKGTSPRCIVLSPGKKYVIVPIFKHRNSGFALLDVRTGTTVGVFEQPSQFLFGFGIRFNDIFEALTFTPTGTKIFGYSNEWIHHWNAANGRLEGSFYVGGHKTPSSLHWIGPKYLLYGSLLIETEQELPIWHYQDTQDGDTVRGGLLWHVRTDMKDNIAFIDGLKIPHRGMPPLPLLPDAQKFSLRPGISVRLNIDPNVPDHANVREAVVRRLAEKNIGVSDSGSISLTAKIEYKPSIPAILAVNDPSGQTKHDVQYTAHRMSFTFEESGKTLWTISQGSMMPGIIRGEDMKGKSPQEIVNDASKPQADWFLRFDCPSRIPLEKAGKSSLYAN